MVRKFLLGLLFFGPFLLFPSVAGAQREATAESLAQPNGAEGALEEATAPALLADPTPAPLPRPDITAQNEEVVLQPLRLVIAEQELGPYWQNPIKYAIRSAVEVGVPPNTIVLLLLLPVVAAIIAGARHLVGLRGFGIFLPAALSIVFLAIGPVLGISLFLVIVAVSIFMRALLRRIKIKLQYLPRMALILWAVVIAVLAVLFSAPIVKHPDLTNVSIFPVLVLVLLAEDFTKVQQGKSARTAINQATETIILSLISFIFLTLESIQIFALTRPELLLLLVALFDLVIGKYIGLRLVEYWRYRKLIMKG